MPKLELLTATESAQAKAEGWLVSHVYVTDRWRVMVLSAGPAMRNAEAALKIVLAKAHLNSALHIKALRLVMASNQPGKKKPK